MSTTTTSTTTTTTTTTAEDGLVDAAAPTATAEAPAPVLPGLVLPRVNLLPPEIAERARLQRLKLGLGAGVLAVAGAVAVLHVAATAGVSEATEQLQVASSTGAALRADSTGFSEVLSVHAQAAASRAVLTAAMGEEVRYSELLDRLTRSVPDNVWLKTADFTQTPGAAAGDEVAVSSATGIGTVTFTGVAFRHDDVAAWLESLSTQEGYAEPSLSDSTAGAVGGRPVVTFTSTVTLTPAALSQRWTDEDGG